MSIYLAALVFDKEYKIYLPVAVRKDKLVNYVQRGTHALFSEMFFFSQGKRRDVDVAELVHVYDFFKNQDCEVYNCFKPDLAELRSVENAQKLVFDFENQSGYFENRDEP